MQAERQKPHPGQAPRARLARTCLWGAFLLASASCAHAQGNLSRLPVHASGVFLNAAGDVLTAGHAVAGCKALYVVKDGRAVSASVLARDASQDLAVLRTAFKPYLSAVFPLTAEAGARSQGVFAEGYEALQHMPARGRTLFNAMTVPGEGGLFLISAVRPGASGSPVLGANGLVLGVVVARVPADGNPSGRVQLSQARRAGTGDATRVRAAAAEDIAAFLRRHGIDHARSDAAQLGPLQAQAPRAATLSAGVICG